MMVTTLEVVDCSRNVENYHELINAFSRPASVDDGKSKSEFIEELLKLKQVTLHIQYIYI